MSNKEQRWNKKTKPGMKKVNIPVSFHQTPLACSSPSFLKGRAVFPVPPPAAVENVVHRPPAQHMLPGDYEDQGPWGGHEEPGRCRARICVRALLAQVTNAAR